MQKLSFNSFTFVCSECHNIMDNDRTVLDGFALECPVCEHITPIDALKFIRSFDQ